MPTDLHFGGRVFFSEDELPYIFDLNQLRKQTIPEKILMCPPQFYNPIGGTYSNLPPNELADVQWKTLKQTFEKSGMEVKIITPEEELEGMVFSANFVFVGLNALGEKVCLLGQKKYHQSIAGASVFGDWFSNIGYRVARLENSEICFQGAADAIWHPGIGLIWGGYGYGTDRRAYTEIAETFNVPVLALELVNDEFTSLNTCFFPLDKNRVLVYKPAFSAESLNLIYRVFNNVIFVSHSDAIESMICNGATILGQEIIVSNASPEFVERLNKLGFQVINSNLSEYQKSRRSVGFLKVSYF